MTKEDIKKICEKFGITQKQLAEEIGYPYTSLSTMMYRGDISQNLKQAILDFLDKNTARLNQESIKEFLEKYNMTVITLAQEIGVAESTLRNALDTKKVTKALDISIKNYFKLKETKKELADIKAKLQALKDI